MRSTLAALPLLAVATLALASCGESTIDSAKGETLIRGVVSKQVGVRVATVTCPDDVKRKQGATFSCAVAGDDGSKGDVLVTQRDDDGNIRVSAPFLHVREAETVMQEQIAKRLEVDDVTIACREIVAVKNDARFACTATAEGRSREISARLTDGQGRFRYRLI